MEVNAAVSVQHVAATDMGVWTPAPTGRQEPNCVIHANIPRFHPVDFAWISLDHRQSIIQAIENVRKSA